MSRVDRRHRYEAAMFRPTMYTSRIWHLASSYVMDNSAIPDNAKCAVTAVLAEAVFEVLSAEIEEAEQVYSE